MLHVVNYVGFNLIFLYRVAFYFYLYLYFYCVFYYLFYFQLGSKVHFLYLEPEQSGQPIFKPNVSPIFSFWAHGDGSWQGFVFAANCTSPVCTAPVHPFLPYASCTALLFLVSPASRLHGAMQPHVEPTCTTPISHLNGGRTSPSLNYDSCCLFFFASLVTLKTTVPWVSHSNTAPIKAGKENFCNPKSGG